MRYLIALILAVSAAAQTTDVTKSAFGANKVGPGIYILAPNGQPVVAVVGPNLSLTQGPGNTWILDAVPLTPSSFSIRHFPFTVTAVGNNVTLPSEPRVGGTVSVARNGVLMALGRDYSVTGTTVTFISPQDLRVGDTLSFVYIEQ